MSDPLVVTLRCHGPGWTYCQELRERHFPKDRNVVPAHIALFHQLPGEELDQIRADAERAWTDLFAVRIVKVRSLGRGVALVIEAPPLLALHRGLSGVWQQWLTSQDQQKFSPHVTIQNKVEPAEARRLSQNLQAGFTPFEFEAIGIDIWHYRKGPWEHVDHVSVSSSND